jgi:AcrR family transcriptional regulator
MTVTPAGPGRKPPVSRRAQILQVAAELFARHGFHGVSIAELGLAVGTTGPALYRHFPSKEALLAEILVGISERLLDGGRTRAAGSADPQAVLDELIDFHVEFALREPELIVVQERDLANLPAASQRRVRGLQRAYVEVWVDTLVRLHPDLPADSARVAAHGAFGLLNSTPYTSLDADEATVADVLRRMARAALTDRLHEPGQVSR